MWYELANRGAAREVIVWAFLCVVVEFVADVVYGLGSCCFGVHSDGTIVSRDVLFQAPVKVEK